MKIFGQYYEIVKKDMENELLGGIDSSNGKIYIQKDLPNSIMESTILHEVIHVISENLNLGLDEVQVHGLECGLYDCGYRNSLIE